MNPLRLTHLPLLAGLLVGCPDSQGPKPPPRVPKPKVELESAKPRPADPIKTGPVRERQVNEV